MVPLVPLVPLAPPVYLQQVDPPRLLLLLSPEPWFWLQYTGDQVQQLRSPAPLQTGFVKLRLKDTLDIPKQKCRNVEP